MTPAALLTITCTTKAESREAEEARSARERAVDITAS
jgi:hypothetical protein